MDRSGEGEPARWSVLRPRISDYSCRKEQCTLRRTPSGHGSTLAGESTSMVSSRLRNFLCRQICQRESARPEPELLGIVGRLQILGGGRDGTRTGQCKEEHNGGRIWGNLNNRRGFVRREAER